MKSPEMFNPIPSIPNFEEETSNEEQKEYFFVREGDGEYQEVSRDEYKRYESMAGFRPKNPGELATSSFSNDNVSGRSIKGFVARSKEQAERMLEDRK